MFSKAERFYHFEGFSNGLADITDAKYSAHYDRMVTYLRAPVASDQLQSKQKSRT